MIINMKVELFHLKRNESKLQKDIDFKNMGSNTDKVHIYF